MPLSAGTRLGPYEIAAPLGVGGMGEVYRARDSRLKRDVALKVLLESFAKNANMMVRFQREAEVLASLNHPNIAAIYGFEENALVMELVEGPRLADRIAAGPLPLEEALQIARQIAEALEYAHEKGVVHRDLKPANVKITPQGVAKVLDFGLAKVMETTESSRGSEGLLTLTATQPGTIMGTPGYMAPEQARGEAVDRRADIWAFGVILYEMLTGVQPFRARTMSDTLAAVLTREPSLDKVPEQVRPLLQRCLRKEARQRLQAIGEARIAIEEAAEKPANTEAAAALPGRSSRRWKIVAAAALVSAAAALYSAWRVPRPAARPLARLALSPGAEFKVWIGDGAHQILSPDGSMLVYTGVGPDGQPRLYTRPLHQEQSAPLAETEGAFNPFFSPDGQHVGFFAGSDLKKASVQSGQVVTLCPAPSGRGGSWGDDGNIIAALTSTSFLSRVPSGGGTPQPVTEMKQELTHRWPQVLPGAQAVLFTAHTSAMGFDEARIEAQSLRTGQRKTLVRGGAYGRYVSSGHLLYVRQSILYAAPMDAEKLELTGPPVRMESVASNINGGAQFDVSASGEMLFLKNQGARQLIVWLDSASEIRPLRSRQAEYATSITFSPDGKRLALVIVEAGNPDLWVYDLERETLTRLTFTPGYDGFPVWSPDGQHLAFTSARHGGAQNLYWMRADGGGEAVQLTQSPFAQFPSSISPDGRRLAFTQVEPQTFYDLWTVPLEDPASDNPKAGRAEVFLKTPFREVLPIFSPDGKWIAYESTETGNMETYVRPFPGPGGKRQISEGAAQSAPEPMPKWSKKGNQLLYGGAEGIMVADYSVTGGMFVSGKPRLWARMKVEHRGWFDVAPDGRRIAVVDLGTGGGKGPEPIVFLLNFFDELRRRAPAGRK